MQSLTSRGLVKTQYSWRYYYYTMTPEGLDYLREWLHLPAEIVPATHIKQQRSHAPPRGMMGEEGRGERRGGFGGRGRGGDRGDREGGYRRRDAGEGKEGGAPGDFAPQLYVQPVRPYFRSMRHANMNTAVVDSVVAVALLPRRKASDCDWNGGHDSHNRWCLDSGIGTHCMIARPGLYSTLRVDGRLVTLLPTAQGFA